MKCWKAVITVRNKKDTWKVCLHKWGKHFTKKEAADHVMRTYSGCQIEVLDIEIFPIDERTGERL